MVSDVAIDHHFIPAENLKSQQYLNNIHEWTQNKKMLLNKKKTQYMIFNFTRKFQFSTRLQLENENIQFEKQAKLLGIIINSDLKWSSNTSYLIKKAYARMEILRKLFPFCIPIEDLVIIYIIFIRSVLENSSVVWHSSITQEEITDIERIQKTALRIILKNNYENYQNALIITKLDTLEQRRENLCLDFAKTCTKSTTTSDMFPLNKQTNSILRHKEKYVVQHASKERLKNSAIPYMQRLLNKFANT